MDDGSHGPPVVVGIGVMRRGRCFGARVLSVIRSKRLLKTSGSFYSHVRVCKWSVQVICLNHVIRLIRFADLLA